MDAYINHFKALSDRTRLRIMKAVLNAGKELCICEIMDTLKLAQYNVSRHIKELKNAGLVGERKEGRFVFYRLLPAETNFHKQLLKILETVSDPVLDDDKERLRKRLSLRENDRCVIGMKKCGKRGN